MKIPSQLLRPSTTLAVVASFCICGVAGAANIAGEGFAIRGVHTGVLMMEVI